MSLSIKVNGMLIGLAAVIALAIGRADFEPQGSETAARCIGASREQQAEPHSEQVASGVPKARRAGLTSAAALGYRACRRQLVSLLAPGVGADHL